MLSVDFPALVQAQLDQWSGHPSFAWAGECGIFADQVWHAAQAAGLSVVIDGFSGSLVCDAHLPPLPGIGLDELTALGVAQGLDHAWLTFDGRHHDAAHPQGVPTPWGLRCVRQALVEMLAMVAPQRLDSLCEAHPFWAESKRLSDDFATIARERDPLFSMR